VDLSESPNFMVVNNSWIESDIMGVDFLFGHFVTLIALNLGIKGQLSQ
jgi:hypothetical protein